MLNITINVTKYYVFAVLQNAFCVFNYNIGFFTFISGKFLSFHGLSNFLLYIFCIFLPPPPPLLLLHLLHHLVFAYVGGTYFFFKAVLNFTVHCVRVLSAWLIKNLKQKTKQNITRIHTLTMSVSQHYRTHTNIEESNELLTDKSDDEEEKEKENNSKLTTPDPPSNSVSATE